VVRSLLELREQLQGSLFARYGICGKEGCACRQGHKHGPYWVLSTRSAGKGEFTYLERDTARRARDLVRKHREFRSGMQRLRRLNLELVDLLKRYQADASKRTGRRLGLPEARG
jgi:hypothetical protein